MRIFISGGCKNGKSFYAQRLSKAQANEKLYYIATMAPVDNEDRTRIHRHRSERDGWGFETVECPVNISNIVTSYDINGSFLIDSLTALLANEMFGANGNIVPNVHQKMSCELEKLFTCLDKLVIVSDYIYSDASHYDELTERYRHNLAYLDRFSAKHCDIVLECVYSQLIVHKGEEAFNRLYEKII